MVAKCIMILRLTFHRLAHAATAITVGFGMFKFTFDLGYELRDKVKRTVFEKMDSDFRTVLLDELKRIETKQDQIKVLHLPNPPISELIESLAGARHTPEYT